MLRVLVEVSNGVVQRVLTTSEEIEVLVVDRDTGGSDASNILPILGEDASADSLKQGKPVVDRKVVSEAFMDAEDGLRKLASAA
jgi:hypothetical protein